MKTFMRYINTTISEAGYKLDLDDQYQQTLDVVIRKNLDQYFGQSLEHLVDYYIERYPPIEAIDTESQRKTLIIFFGAVLLLTNSVFNTLCNKLSARISNIRIVATKNTFLIRFTLNGDEAELVLDTAFDNFVYCRTTNEIISLLKGGISAIATKNTYLLLRTKQGRFNASDFKQLYNRLVQLM